VKARLAGASAVCSAAGLAEPGAVRVLGFEGRADSAEAFDSLARAFAGHLLDRLGDRRSSPAGRPGLLAANDIEAALATRACRHLGWTPGEDVLIAGYDHAYPHLPERRWEAQPPCVTIDKRLEDLGVAAVESLRAGGLEPASPARVLEPILVATDRPPHGASSADDSVSSVPPMP
jgi:DNA-binding LacI/PurR family transcriptional regulator